MFCAQLKVKTKQNGCNGNAHVYSAASKSIHSPALYIDSSCHLHCNIIILTSVTLSYICIDVKYEHLLRLLQVLILQLKGCVQQACK